MDPDTPTTAPLPVDPATQPAPPLEVVPPTDVEPEEAKREVPEANWSRVMRWHGQAPPSPSDVELDEEPPVDGPAVQPPPVSRHELVKRLLDTGRWIGTLPGDLAELADDLDAAAERIAADLAGPVDAHVEPGEPPAPTPPGEPSQPLTGPLSAPESAPAGVTTPQTPPVPPAPDEPPPEAPA